MFGLSRLEAQIASIFAWLCLRRYSSWHSETWHSDGQQVPRKIVVRPRPSSLTLFFPEPAKLGTIFETAHFLRFSPGCLTPSVYNFGEVSDYYLCTLNVQCTLQFSCVCFKLRRRYLPVNFVARNPCQGDAWRICVQCHFWPRISRRRNCLFQVCLQPSIDRQQYYKAGEFNLYSCSRFKITGA